MVVSIKTGFYAEMEIDMKKLENKCMLITYSDSMGHNLADLNEILDKYFKKAFKKVMVNPNANSHIEILCEKYFVLCTSSLLGVQMAAINYYYDVFQNMKNYEILKQKYAYTNKLFHEIDTKIGNGAEIIKERELRDQSLELLKKMQSIIKQNGLLE